MEREYSEKPKNLSQLSRKTAISERRAMFERNASSNNEQPVPQFARSYTSNRSVVNINPGRSSIAVVTANSTSPVNISTPAAASPDKLLPSTSCDTTSSTLTVGKYKLELTSQGKVVVFRGDNRTPEQIVAAGGFGEQSNYLYKMEIPGLKPQDMNERTLGEKIRQDSRGN
ncbi:hypothetical protein Ppb6_01884 [Photorhabdus australis subsp. thailandensis]|uniref:Uncharacterized protein n=1 Tax=Photorhabdus australis subsp. thailandensis TaxID=2805096 RepID=A0A1C0U519_9GAMM|nr:hypothetical protein [Photorhabdus australis]OCQ52991.1 hypothetical protein Ppb6_01884 [Photorhabdus australis subsp. thailandensis]